MVKKSIHINEGKNTKIKHCICDCSTVCPKLKVILYRHVQLLLYVCSTLQNLQIHEWLIILYHSPLLLYTYVCSVLCGTMNDGSS